MKASKSDTGGVDSVAQQVLEDSTAAVLVFAALVFFLSLTGNTFTRASEESLRQQTPPLRLLFARPPPSR